MKTLLTLLTAACASLLMSCTYGMNEVFDHGTDVEGRVGALVDITGPSVSGSTYSFVVLSDVHRGKEEDMLFSSKERYDDAFFEKVRATTPLPSFCICLGDIADHGWSKELDEYNEFVARINETLGAAAGENKVLSVLGNHDVYNEGWESWKERIYPHTSFYRFNIGAFNYYVTDSASGSIGMEQYKKLKEAMKNDNKPKIVCSHYAVFGTQNFFSNYYTTQNTEESDLLLTLYAQTNTRLILAGHMHEYHTTRFTSQMEEVLVPGYFDKAGYVIITVDDNTATIYDSGPIYFHSMPGQ